MTKKLEHPNYEIGYGKPPVASRFKPGHSGNPKGRPKRTALTSELVMKVAEEKIVVMIDEKPTKMSKRDALLRAMFANALKGNMSATNQVLKLLERAEALIPRTLVKHVVTVAIVEPDLSRYDPSTMPPRLVERSAKPASAILTPPNRHPLE